MDFVVFEELITSQIKKPNRWWCAYTATSMFANESFSWKERFVGFEGAFVDCEKLVIMEMGD